MGFSNGFLVFKTAGYPQTFKIKLLKLLSEFLIRLELLSSWANFNLAENRAKELD